MSDKESHNQCTHKFIDLANELKDLGHDPQLVSAALMAASGIYATFITAGNTGGLQPSGVDKDRDDVPAQPGTHPGAQKSGK